MRKCKRAGGTVADRLLHATRRAGIFAIETLENRTLLTAALSFDSVPHGYGSASFKPIAQAVGDFNGDSIPDLVVTNQTNSTYPGPETLQILIGNGDGNFHPGGTAVVGLSSLVLIVGDFNNDHKADVMATASNDTRVAILIGNGNGTLNAPAYIDNDGSEPSALALGDFNRDGAIDLAVSAGLAPSHIFLGDGLGIFTFGSDSGSEGASGLLLPREQSSIATDDVNGDGKLDLVSSDESGPNPMVHVALGKGDGKFFASLTFATTLPASQIVIADVNNDGRLDLVMSEGSFDGYIGAVKLGNGDGTFGPDILLAVPDQPDGIAVADFDLDFKPDIVFGSHNMGGPPATQNVNLFRGDGHGGFAAVETRYVSDDDPQNLVSADFNRDGRPDLAATLFSALYDFALINTAVFQSSIRGVVFNDDNQNGLYGAGEMPLAGRTVYIDANGNGGFDSGEQFAVTQSDGSYELIVPNGTYTIRQVLPAAWNQTSPTGAPGAGTVAYTVIVSSHSIRAGYDFGTYFRGTISGTLFNDSNANQMRDSFEDAPIPLQRTVYIDANDNGVLDSGETSVLANARGIYRFILPPGTYRVRQVLPAGWFQTTPPGTGGKTGGYLITVAANQVAINLDFGSTQPGGISGRVFYDTVADGISADSDPGRSSFKVFVDTNFNGGFDTGEPFTFTDATGHYNFSNLFPGSYAVGIVKPPGWVQTTPISTLGTFQTRVVGGGGDVGGYVDFGVIYPSYVTGRVFNDLDGNGNQTAGENGLAGFGVFVDVSGTGYGSFTDPATQTDAQGNFTLRVPVDGTYNVRVTRPSGWQSTIPSSNSYSIVFSNGSTVSGKNFGLKQGAFNNAGFKNPVNYAASQFNFVNPASVTTGDFNLDKNQDFAVANNSGDVSLFLNTGLGTFTRSSIGFGGSGKRSIITAFVNADNIPDLVTANQEDGTVSVFLGSASGTFQSSVDYTAAPGAYCVVAADFTSDNKIDLAVGGISGTQVVLLVGNGLGAFAAPANIGASAGTYAIATGDFDKDNKKDLAWVNQSSNSVIVIRGNGNGTFQSPVTITTGINQPGSIAIGDFNKDTFPDLAVLNQFSDIVRVITGVGNGTFNSGVNYGTGSTPAQVTTLDVDGDGWTDLAVAYESDGTTDISGGINILRNHGDGTFEPALTSTAHTSPNSVAVADFNGDSLPDLVATNFFGDDVSVMLNNRSAAATISGTVFNDLNGDGTKSAGEGFLAGRVVYLDLDNNSALSAGEPSTTTDASGNFLFNTVLPGQYVVRIAADPNYAQTLPVAGAGITVQASAGSAAVLSFGLHDVSAPQVFNAQFTPNAPAMKVQVVFAEDVGPSLTVSDFQLLNRNTGATVATSSLSLTYSASTLIASLTFPGFAHGQLPDGNYRLTLPAGAVADASGNALVTAFTFDFSVLAGDANNDGAVGFADLVAVAQNYGAIANTSFAKGDYNYDGKVDFADLVIVAQKYGSTLPPPLAAPVPATLPSKPTAVKPLPLVQSSKSLFSATPIVKSKPIVSPLQR